MFELLKGRLKGPFYTIFTPFDDKENIDYECLERYLKFLYSQGAKRFYAMAYNSRYSQLSDVEILELNQFCIRTLKKLDKNNIVIVGDPIHGSTKNSLLFAEHAKENGADIISLIFREKYFEDEQVLDHYEFIGRNADFPILVHEMPFLSGKDGKQMHWPKSLLLALPKIPQIIALKEDAHDFEMTKIALELEPNIRVIIAGMKKSFLQYKPYGALAYLNGISMIDARIGETFWKAYEGDDKQTLQFILKEIEAPFFEHCAAKFGWHRTNKALLQAAGIMHRRERMPLKHLSHEDYTIVQETYNEIARIWSKYLEQ